MAKVKWLRANKTLFKKYAKTTTYFKRKNKTTHIFLRTNLWILIQKVAR